MFHVCHMDCVGQYTSCIFNDMIYNSYATVSRGVTKICISCHSYFLGIHTHQIAFARGVAWDFADVCMRIHFF